MADLNPSQDATSFDPNTQSHDSIDQPLDADMDMIIDPAPQPEDPLVEPPPEPRLPARKDISLRDFLSKMDDYAPIIPDAVTQYHLTLAGLPPSTTPLPLSRLLALATQKFIADIAADAYQYSRMRSSASGASAPSAAAAAGAATGVPGAAQQTQQQSQQREEKGKGGAHVLGVPRAGFGGGGGGGGQGRAVLTMEDLGCAVGEYGVNVRRGEFYR
ncbi:hypothetical protein MMC07_008271 [Pseudocyphellaria aurata]|nr:hypothetical protein [Pseudocyphellaria aurata]